MHLIRLALLLVAMCWGSVAAAEWRRAESPHFIVYSEDSEARLRERVLVLEDFHQLMRTITGTTAATSPNKLHVYVVSGNKDLQEVKPVGKAVGGFYTATGEGISAFVDSGATSRADGNLVLFHEYGHHFMWQYAPSAYPGWYIEGFAEYFSTAKFTSRHIDIGNFSPGRIYSVTQGPWLPMERVFSAGPHGLNAEAAAAYYAQAWLMTHYFFSNPERVGTLRRYLAASRTSDPVTALKTATGMTAEQFTKELRRYIGRGTINFRRMERTSSGAPPAVTVSVLPRSADDLMLHAAALRIGIDRDRAAAQLQRIRAAAARHPTDSFALPTPRRCTATRRRR